MDMDGWRDILHFDFHGEHVLFSSLRLSSGFTFLLASLLTIFLCLLERYLTYGLSNKWNTVPTPHSHLSNAVFRAGVYWVLTLLRLLYMLLAMTFHVGLIFVVVTTLSVGQFAIEYAETPQLLHLKPRLEGGGGGAPLLGREEEETSAEYLDIPRAASSYPPPPPPRKKAKAKALSAASDADATVGERGTAVFAIDDEDERV